MWLAGFPRPSVKLLASVVRPEDILPDDYAPRAHLGYTWTDRKKRLGPTSVARLDPLQHDPTPCRQGDQGQRRSRKAASNNEMMRLLAGHFRPNMGADAASFLSLRLRMGPKSDCRAAADAA